jgi:hypothetical protein
MLSKIGYIQFQTHKVLVSKDLDDPRRIYCFKSTDTRCDMQSFTDESSAADYILEPMPSLVYYIRIAGEDPEE